MCCYMIKTLSFLSRKSQVTFGNIRNLRKFLKIFGTFVWLRTTFGKSQKIFEKCSEIFRKSSSYVGSYTMLSRETGTEIPYLSSSIYFVRPKYSCMYSRCEMLSCSQTWYKALVAASAHNCVRYMLLLAGSLILSYDCRHLLGKHRIIWQMDFI